MHRHLNRMFNLISTLVSFRLPYSVEMQTLQNRTNLPPNLQMDWETLKHAVRVVKETLAYGIQRCGDNEHMYICKYVTLYISIHTCAGRPPYKKGRDTYMIYCIYLYLFLYLI